MAGLTTQASALGPKISNLHDAVLGLTRRRTRRERMELPKMSRAAASATDSGSALRKLLVQGVFLFMGVFSTCVAQLVFYQGAVDHWQLLAQLSSALERKTKKLQNAKPASSTLRDELAGARCVPTAP
ncbi:hypothetical protein PF008_g18494 [Phytophthora fragariae]|uniref:Uncharacterized protein n=1 Tax=Phytophthora fragariae TaxID=53985 RepID=A0A6G0R556_9STRA|nr:hypothetical protein PF008_g18494 [Phytophthora fragariae]